MTTSHSASFDTASTLANLLADPRTAHAMRDIQSRAIALLEHKIDAMVVALGKAEPAAATLPSGAVVNVRQLAMTSRQAGGVVQNRRQFARDILIATLINHNNDEWDMTDATTWRDDPDDLLIALMKLPPLEG